MQELKLVDYPDPPYFIRALSPFAKRVMLLRCHLTGTHSPFTERGKGGGKKVYPENPIILSEIIAQEIDNE